MSDAVVIRQQSERGGKINALGNAEQKPQTEQLAGIGYQTSRRSNDAPSRKADRNQPAPRKAVCNHAGDG